MKSDLTRLIFWDRILRRCVRIWILVRVGSIRIGFFADRDLSFCISSVLSSFPEAPVMDVVESDSVLVSSIRLFFITFLVMAIHRSLALFVRSRELLLVLVSPELIKSNGTPSLFLSSLRSTAETSSFTLSNVIDVTFSFLPRLDVVGKTLPLWTCLVIDSMLLFRSDLKLISKRLFVFLDGAAESFDLTGSMVMCKAESMVWSCLLPVSTSKTLPFHFGLCSEGLPSLSQFEPDCTFSIGKMFSPGESVLPRNVSCGILDSVFLPATSGSDRSTVNVGRTLAVFSGWSSFVFLESSTMILAGCICVTWLVRSCGVFGDKRSLPVWMGESARRSQSLSSRRYLSVMPTCFVIQKWKVRRLRQTTTTTGRKVKTAIPTLTHTEPCWKKHIWKTPS